MKKTEASQLCQQCTSFAICFDLVKGKLFRQELMKKLTYCSRFDNKDREPRLFPVLQPYELDIYNAIKK